MAATVPCFAGRATTRRPRPPQQCRLSAERRDPGTRNGKRCLGGPNNGPVLPPSAWPARSAVSRRTWPRATVDDLPHRTVPPTTAARSANAYSARSNQHRPNHTERGRSSDAACDDVPGARVSFQRACFTENGVVGATLSVNGCDAPPAWIADPTVALPPPPPADDEQHPERDRWLSRFAPLNFRDVPCSPARRADPDAGSTRRRPRPRSRPRWARARRC
jgi:hypothetical protein